jgi:hypothetical protein
MLQDRQALSVGVNAYVPAMAYSGSGGISLGPCRHSLGTPAAAGALATLISAQGTVGPITYLASPIKLDARYGRTITVTPSGVPGNANAVDVVGYDYLGQPMFERFTGSAAASTPLVGLKAFGWIVGTRVNVAATNAITVSIGAGVSLGLPWKGRIITAKEGTTNMTFAQIDTNTVAAVLTDPQTATTGDPRGLYTPTTAPNGTNAYELSMVGDPSVNTANNGGLLGIRHLSS